MAFFLDKNATREELTDAVNYLLANFVQVKTVNPNSGEVTSATTGISGYLYRYLFVKYADSFNGEVNFSNTPTNRLYYGVANSESDVESLVPSDYLWREVPGGMGTTKYFWYSTNGGRQIQTYIGTTKPYQNYIPDDGYAIDLDLITNGIEDLTPPVVDTYAVAKQIVSDSNVTPILELGEVLQGKFFDLSYSNTFTGYGKATFHADVAIDPTKKLYFNTNTYLVESSAGVFDTYVGGVKVVSSTATGTTLIGHPTLETVTATGATGTGKLVFNISPTFAGHPTVEGVTSTGATGTGRFVFDTSPTLITPLLGTPTSGNFSTGTFTWPTFNQDTTGKAAKLYTSPNAYSFTGINTVSGTSVSVFSGTLPAGSATSTNQWMEVIIDSTSFWIPIWAK